MIAIDARCSVVGCIHDDSTIERTGDCSLSQILVEVSDAGGAHEETQVVIVIAVGGATLLPLS